MKNTNSNGTTKTASKTRKGGPRGKREILTPAQLREKLLRTMMLKEQRKVDAKLARVQRRLDKMRDRLETLTATRNQLLDLSEQYGAELSKS